MASNVHASDCGGI